MKTPILLMFGLLGAIAHAQNPPVPTPAPKPLDFVGQLAAKLEPTRIIPYKKVGERELRLHIFEPKGFQPSNARACYISIHGGGWTGGEPRRMYPFVADAAAAGMVGISVEYRLLKEPGVTVFDCVKDGRSAVRYVRAHAKELGIDPNRIAVSGGSAGGHVAAGTAMFEGVDEAGEDIAVSSVPQALVLLFPVIDTSAEGYGNQKIGERWKELSPAHQVHKGIPPTLTFHGTADTTTPFKGAQLFHEAMIAAGNRSELVVNEGGVHGHLMRDEALFKDSLAKTRAFLASLGFLNAPSGVVMDDEAGQFTGSWKRSTKQAPLFGEAYHTADDSGESSVTFTPDLPAGEYEVRVLYMAHSNRAENVPVTIVSAEGTMTLPLNQRMNALDEKGVPKALGVFQLEPGKASVTLSNAGTKGYTVVDAVQFIPVALAEEERAGKRVAGFPTAPSLATPRADPAEALRDKLAASVAVSPLAAITAESKPSGVPLEPVNLAKDANPADVNGQTYDLVVVGATGGGVACAVRAAREGCRVLLVQHNRHIGGMMSNGLMQWDALYGGPRAPLFTELLGNIEKHYITHSGKDSRDHQIIRYTHQKYPIGWAESHVAEREFNRLVSKEKNLTLLLEHYPSAVERDGAILRSVTLRKYGTTEDIRVQATMFADGTYEGDLFALAKVPYRVGREARAEYNEPHAGKVFANIDHSPAPQVAVEGKLNIRPYSSKQGSVDPTSPFTADGAVQAYNYRFCVSRDPNNRVMLTEPPANYNREEYVNYDRKSISTNSGPRMKSHMNSPILPGENHAYPEADWATREKIIARHRDFGLGLIWFLQNDESVSPSAREKFREWGLAKDEFPDHGHIPYEMYVREARRIVGRHVFTELDNSLVPGLARTPVMPDSVAVTDWYMDSHSCTMDSRPGFRYDGKLILTEESRPAQIPYRALLPQGVDNLLVPVCLSATHIAWGAVRLEPVWMQTGEAAGLAAGLAKKNSATPAALNPDTLLRELTTRRHLVSFFNDMKVDAEGDWIPAAQYFGAKGFFASYDALPAEPLRKSTAQVWAKAWAELAAGKLDAMATFWAVSEAEKQPAEPITGTEFAALFPAADGFASTDSKPVTRENALAMLWHSLQRR